MRTYSRRQFTCHDNPATIPVRAGLPEHQTVTQSPATPPVSRRHPVLVPVDFSACSRSALVCAARMVEGSRTPLLLLHVIHDPAGRPGLYRNRDRRHSARPIIDIAAEMVADMLDGVRNQEPGLPALENARTLLIRGLPGRRIVEVAERERAALIIMGTHGRDGFAHLLQGSVAEYVTKFASAPVMTVKDENFFPVSLNLDSLQNAKVPGGI